MKIKKIISSIGIGAGAIIMGLGIQYVVAQTSTWSPAPNTPPNCPAGYPGCDAPVNVGSSGQVKNGPLTLNFTNAVQIGLKVLGQIQIVDGNQGYGKVLMSDGNGVATWVSTSSLGLGGNNTTINNYTHYQLFGVGTHTFTVPSGVTSIEAGAWGGGGGGGGQGTTGYGSGGRAGGINSGTFTVSPGSVITVIVGNGGQAGPDGSCANSVGSGGVNASISVGVSAQGGSGGGCTSNQSTISGQTGSLLFGFGPYGKGGDGAPGGDTNPCSGGYCTITAQNGSAGQAIILW